VCSTPGGTSIGLCFQLVRHEIILQILGIARPPQGRTKERPLRLSFPARLRGFVASFGSVLKITQTPLNIAIAQIRPISVGLVTTVSLSELHARPLRRVASQ
jgi:hypothetical protein